MSKLLSVKPIFKYESQSANGWRAVECSSLIKLAGIIRTCWSPIVFKGGVRSTECFEVAHYLGIDIDGGMPLAEAKNIWSDVRCVIAPTKSHQINKHGVTCDRYRVIFPLEEPITNAADYKATTAHYVKKYCADDAAADAARWFWPCKFINSSDVFINLDGYFCDQFKAPPPSKRAEARAHSGIIPHWTIKLLKTPLKVGERDATVFSIACGLLKSGMTADRAFEVIQNSDCQKLADKPHTEREVIKCIKSAAKTLAKDTGGAVMG